MANDPQHTEAQTAHSEDDRPEKHAPRQSTTGLILKKTGKALWASTALDVIVKDAKRMRPLHPQLWKDVFGRKGRDALLGRSSNNRPPGTGESRIIGPAAISAALGFIVAGYGLMFALSLADAANAPMTNKIIALLLTAFGLIYAITNASTALIAAKKVAQAKSQSKPAVSRKKGAKKSSRRTPV